MWYKQLKKYKQFVVTCTNLIYVSFFKTIWNMGYLAKRKGQTIFDYLVSTYNRNNNLYFCWPFLKSTLKEGWCLWCDGANHSCIYHGLLGTRQNGCCVMHVLKLCPRFVHVIGGDKGLRKHFINLALPFVHIYVHLCLVKTFLCDLLTLLGTNGTKHIYIVISQGHKSDLMLQALYSV